MPPSVKSGETRLHSVWCLNLPAPLHSFSWYVILYYLIIYTTPPFLINGVWGNCLPLMLSVIHLLVPKSYSFPTFLLQITLHQDPDGHLLCSLPPTHNSHQLLYTYSLLSTASLPPPPPCHFLMHTLPFLFPGARALCSKALLSLVQVAFSKNCILPPPTLGGV